ncbi:CASP-like protein 2D1 isoform X2 [Tasmannia lanceolata]|uniref:CASP-like protein 2D1 isoform X2 n=1 Tax=Tasmannia lanceolata TaxID=3420 RepID=UPI004063EFBB
MSSIDENKPSSTNPLHSLRYLDVSLRLTAIPLSVVSIWVMVTNKQDSLYGSLKFSNLTGLNCCFLMAEELFQCLGFLCFRPVAEILYLGYKGDRDVSWSEACSSYGKFCNKMVVSLVLHVVVLVCFIVLSLISAYRVFSRFEAPSVSSKEGEEQVQ